ncbi:MULTISPECIES: hypothetical protein [Paenibacillus]|uniref:hypothetical protein n=1 Tax=Paenibacillus TaxID=44249 RepID=UPI0015C3C894|nr:hypothetical protein [Paenibacillus amylolyticus]
MRYQDTLFYDDGSHIPDPGEGPFTEVTYVSEKEEDRTAVETQHPVSPQPERAA